MLGRGSFLRFKCSFPTFTFPHCPSDQRVVGELALSHHACLGASTVLPDHLASDDSFHRSIRGSPTGITTSHKTQLLAVNLVRCINSPEFAGLYFVDTLPQPDIPSVPTTSVNSGRHPLPITGVGNPEPSNLLAVSLALLSRVLFGTLQHGRQLHPKSSLRITSACAMASTAGWKIPPDSCGMTLWALDNTSWMMSSSPGGRTG